MIDDTSDRLQGFVDKYILGLHFLYLSLSTQAKSENIG